MLAEVPSTILGIDAGLSFAAGGLLKLMKMVQTEYSRIYPRTHGIAPQSCNLDCFFGCIKETDARRGHNARLYGNNYA